MHDITDRMCVCSTFPTLRTVPTYQTTCSNVCLHKWTQRPGHQCVQHFTPPHPEHTQAHVQHAAVTKRGGRKVHSCRTPSMRYRNSVSLTRRPGRHPLRPRKAGRATHLTPPLRCEEALRAHAHWHWRSTGRRATVTVGCTGRHGRRGFLCVAKCSIYCVYVCTCVNAHRYSHQSHAPVRQRTTTHDNGNAPPPALLRLHNLAHDCARAHGALSM